MQIKLHANARTTPKTRAMIQSSDLSVAALARDLGLSETTVRRWKSRDRVTDGSHVPHNLHASTTPTEEALIVALRRDVVLSLDDIVEVMHRCVNPNLSRSAIHRCLVRHGVSRRAVITEAGRQTGSGRFDPDIPCGFIHVDLKHLPRLEGRAAYIWVAIDRATRFVHIEIIEKRDARSTAACLERFIASFPHPVHTVLTDNGSEFTDRFAVDKKNKPEGKPSGDHPFDARCRRAGIEHRLTKPFHPQTNGMVERFNRRLAEAIRAHPGAGTNRGKNKFKDRRQRNAFLEKIVHDYNRTRLRCLNYVSPIEAINNLSGHNTKARDTGGGAEPAITSSSTVSLGLTQGRFRRRWRV